MFRQKLISTFVYLLPKRKKEKKRKQQQQTKEKQNKKTITRKTTQSTFLYKLAHLYIY